jgi:hypothetical protein
MVLAVGEGDPASGFAYGSPSSSASSAFSAVRFTAESAENAEGMPHDVK